MKLKINIDGKEYEADIEVLEEERHEAPAAAARGAAKRSTGTAATPPAPAVATTPGASSDKLCVSSIVGIVVSVSVTVGQEVKAGDPVLVLEAMKMESNVASPVTGRVKAILVNAGESVKKGQALIEFE